MTDYALRLSQFQKIANPLAAPNTPKVSATTGLGTGGGAAVQTPDSDNYGNIRVFPGKGASAAGSVALTFPSAPQTMKFLSDPAFGTVTQATVGNVITVSWTGATFPAAAGFRAFDIRYEWAISD